MEWVRKRNEEEMLSERSTSVLKSLPDTNTYAGVMVVLLVGTSVALASGRDWLGLTGFLILAFMSLTYGAVRTTEDTP